MGALSDNAAPRQIFKVHMPPTVKRGRVELQRKEDNSKEYENVNNIW